MGDMFAVTHVMNCCRDGEYKRYPSDREQLQQNQRDKEVQRQRDERARNEASYGKIVIASDDLIDM
jgi:hypothetical protein